MSKEEKGNPVKHDLKNGEIRYASWTRTSLSNKLVISFFFILLCDNPSDA
jgi:hypothetical protein